MSLSTPNIYAFIDSQNLNLGVKNDIVRQGKIIYTGWPLDFKSFFIYLKTKYNVAKAFLFIGKVPGNEGLYASLTSFGYQLVFKPTLQYVNSDNQPQTKGNVDAELVLHTMIQLTNFDKAIIVAGDGDYYCLVEYLVRNNRLLHIMIPNKYSYSQLLTPFVKYMVFVSDLKNSLIKK